MDRKQTPWQINLKGMKQSRSFLEFCNAQEHKEGSEKPFIEDACFTVPPSLWTWHHLLFEHRLMSFGIKC